MKNYGNLFNAIWVQAVKDDLRLVRQVAYKKGRDIAYNIYINKTGEETEINDTKFKRIYKDIEDYVEMRIDGIDTRIKELVLKEANKWPERHNIRKENDENDERFNNLLQELITDVEQFSEERMLKRWMKI